MNSALINSLFFGLVLVIALSVVTALGLSQNANLSMVDWLFSVFPNQQPTPPILMVSTTEADRSHPALIAELVTDLQVYEPASIYVLGHSALSGEASLANIPGVTLVDSASRLESVGASEAFPPQPASRILVTPVALKAGHFRLWHISQEIKSETYTAFQARLGQFDGIDPAIIDFSMADGLIPLVSANRVLEQGLSPALIENKIVLVGDALEPGLPGFTVPIRQDRGVSNLELQAYVLHSALSNRTLHFTGVISTIVGILILGAISTLLFQWLPSHISALLALVICLLIVALQWAAVKFGAVILPSWELIIAQLAYLLAIHQLQRNREERALNRIIAKTNGRLSERVLPINFNRSDDPWTRILSLVNQQLNIKRSIFLEKVPADHRVKEIEALNCSIEDISERRRDYEREPYSGALEANAPVQPFRDYFTEVEAGEIQYMVPLSFGGEVLGFWALSLIPAKSWNSVAFENNVRSFAAQIAELLYHRQHWHNRSQKAENPLRRLLSVEAGLNLHRQLNNTIELLEHRLDIMEDVLNGLSTAVVVYDVFGQVLQTNSIIEHLAQENNVAVYQMSAMDLLAQSNDIPLEEARNKLRYVTLKHQTLVQSSKLFSSRGSYLLYIRPLLLKRDTDANQVQPFQLRGILFEFADLTQIQRHDEIRQDIADQYFEQLRSHLLSISFAAENISSAEAGYNEPTGQRGQDEAQWLSTIMARTAESSQLTDRVEHELRNQIHMREQTVPTNIAPIIARLVAEVGEAAQVKELRIEYHPPRSNSLNFVEPKTFEQLISALLDLLISDSRHGTEIKVDCSNADDSHIRVMLTSSGHGMPREQLEQTLSTYRSYLDISEDPITKVSVLSQQVLLWGGEMTLKSDIGAGFSIEMCLKTFKLSL